MGTGQASRLALLFPEESRQAAYERAVRTARALAAATTRIAGPAASTAAHLCPAMRKALDDCIEAQDTGASRCNGAEVQAEA